MLFARHTAALTALSMVAAIPFVACGSSNSTPTTPQGSYSASPYGTATAPYGTAYGTATSPYGTATSPYGTATSPAYTAAPTAPANTAPAAPSSQLPPQMVQALLAPDQAKYAPGMQPEGSPFSAQMTEGQHASMDISMTGGKCYTIIGASPAVGGVRDVDLNLLAPPLYTISAGSDAMVGPDAVIGSGSRPYCPLLPIAVPYRLDIYAKSGSGPVGVQLYSKTKS